MVVVVGIVVVVVVDQPALVAAADSSVSRSSFWRLLSGIRLIAKKVLKLKRVSGLESIDQSSLCLNM